MVVGAGGFGDELVIVVLSIVFCVGLVVGL